MSASTSDFQAKVLRDQGWLSAAVIDRVLKTSPERFGTDLCGVLVSSGLLANEQAEQVRQAARGLERMPDSSQEQRRLHSKIQSLFANKVAPGTQIGDGKYEVIKEIARGGMGVILRARAVFLDVEVAVKLVMQAAASEKNLARFRREVETLKRLDHPNIVRILDYGTQMGLPYYVMRYVSGQDLMQVVESHLRSRKRPPDWQPVTAALIPVAEALVYAHEKGVIHRDVKPSNILIEAKTEAPILVDFGLAKDETPDTGDDPLKRLTMSGELIGTPAFMSPEQLLPKGDFGRVSPASDVWSFGATLYFSLTGTRVYAEKSLTGFVAAILHKTPKNPRQLNPEIPRWLDAICVACLQKVADDRPPMTEVIAALYDGTQGEAGAGRVLDRFSAHAEARFRPSSRALFLGLVALTILGAAVLGFALAIEPRTTGVTVEPETPTADTIGEQARRLIDKLDKAGSPIAKLAAIRDLRDLDLKTRPELRSRRESRLSRSLRDVNAEVRVEAAEALAEVGREVAVAPLLERLFCLDDDADVRLAAAAGLYRFRGVEAFAPYLKVREARARIVAAREADRSRPKLTEAERRAYLAEATPRVRLSALTQLENVGLTADLEDLRALAPDLMNILDSSAAPSRLGSTAARVLAVVDGIREPRDYITRARNAAERGRFKDALTAARKAIALLPRSPDPLLARARIYRTLSRSEAGMADIRAALMLEESSGEAYLIRAGFLTDARRYSLALVDLKRALDLRGRLPEAYLMRAQIRRARGDAEGALEDLKRAEELDADLLELTLGYANTYAALRRGDDALKACDKAQLLAPRRYEPYLTRARVLQSLRQYSQSLQALHQASLRGAPELTLSIYRIDANISLSNLEAASQEIELRLEDNPRSIFLLRQRGTVFRLRKQYRLAIAELDKVIAARPGDPIALFERALARYGDGQVKAALDDLDSTLSANAEYARAYYWRAQALLELGRPADALAAINAYLDRGLDDSGRYLRVRILLRTPKDTGDMKVALKDAESLVASEPRNPTYIFMRAQVYATLERYEESLDGFSDAAFLRDDDGAAYLNMASVRCSMAARARKQNKPDEAETHIRDALRLLEIALREGFKDWAFLAQSKGLDILRPDPRFQKLIDARAPEDQRERIKSGS